MAEHRRAVRYEDLELHVEPDEEPRSGAVIVWLAFLGLLVAAVVVWWVVRP